MDLYSIALFAHIVGAVLVFVLLTVEGLGLRFGFAYAPLNRILGPISAVAILIPGIYMMAVQWGWAGWVVVGITTYVLIAAIGAYTGINVMRGRINRQAAIASWLVRIGMALGVLFDMTVKPNLFISAGVVLVVAVIAGGSGLVLRRQVAS
ncbi:MAG: hypothetical protein E6J20_16170 [Chloroflexi bacterium]|nr:MAG: hypothetical protein E6J20_16170 [Chloroflexota bacterium]